PARDLGRYSVRTMTRARVGAPKNERPPHSVRKARHTLVPLPPPDRIAPARTEDMFVRLHRTLHATAAYALRGERAECSVQITALVDETFLRLSTRRAPWASDDEFR